MDIKKWIIDWFSENTTIDSQEIIKNTNENYFAKKWINSLKFIILISAIEENYQITFSNDEFQDRKFATIDGLEEIITAKLNAK